MMPGVRILVTGGAGYIGSHTVLALLKKDFEVLVIDDLSNGHRQALPDDVPLVEASLIDFAQTKACIEQFEPDCVIHFAGRIEVGESERDPKSFYETNLIGSLNLLNALPQPIPIIFSSTAAVYGESETIPIAETAEKKPTNVYGETKLAFEKVLEAYGKAYGLPWIALRYFNACGADASGQIGDDHKQKTHLITRAMLVALGQLPAIEIFGDDYPTPDGSAIRDYIHVSDLANAHVLALNSLLKNGPSRAYNVGLGHGFSVKEVLSTVECVTEQPLMIKNAPRRAGDPACLIADPSLIKNELGWQPIYTDLETMIQTAWNWHRTHPNGF